MHTHTHRDICTHPLSFGSDLLAEASGNPASPALEFWFSLQASGCRVSGLVSRKQKKKYIYIYIYISTPYDVNTIAILWVLLFSVALIVILRTRSFGALGHLLWWHLRGKSQVGSGGPAEL